MTHLSDEQLEEILAGQTSTPDDLDSDTVQRLDEKRIIQGRLVRAASTLHASDELRSSVRLALLDADDSTPAFRRRWIRLAPLGAIAAALLAVVVAIWPGGKPTRAYAQPALARLHAEAEMGHYTPADNADEINRQLSEELNETVNLPAMRGHCSYLGARLGEFRNQRVGQAVVEYKHRKVTLLQLDDRLPSLGFDHVYLKQGRQWGHCHHDACRMAAVEIGGHTYVAIGELSHADLLGLLDQLVKEID